jgi:hypothetical protein
VMEQSNRRRVSSFRAHWFAFVCSRFDRIPGPGPHVVRPTYRNLRIVRTQFARSLLGPSPSESIHGWGRWRRGQGPSGSQGTPR